ncbi:unnamed protein product, partial [Linum tenue]
LSLPSTETNNPLVSSSLSPSLCTRTKKTKKEEYEEEEDAGSRRTRKRRNPHPTSLVLSFSLLSDVVSFSLCDLKSPKSPMKRQTCQGRRVIRRLVG